MFAFQRFSNWQGIDLAEVDGAGMAICRNGLLKLGDELGLGFLGDGISPDHRLSQNFNFRDSSDVIVALDIIKCLLRNPLLRTAGKNQNSYEKTKEVFHNNELKYGGNRVEIPAAAGRFVK